MTDPLPVRWVLIGYELIKSIIMNQYNIKALPKCGQIRPEVVQYGLCRIEG
jgi:hypothetical protein